MQETRDDGADIFTPNASSEEIEKALGDLRNKRVGIYPPGSSVTVAGTEYEIDNHGSFRRKKS